MNFRHAFTLSMLAAAAFPVAARGQRCNLNGATGGNPVSGVYPNVQYDGRFTFARIAYTQSFGGGGRRGGGGNSGNPPWHHDYNRAESHLTVLLTELTKLRARTDGSNVLVLSDPELFKYPIAYMSEPGFWYPSDADVLGLRNYLLKGGFLIFDDFYGDDITNLITQMTRVFPKLQLIELQTNHPVFDSFYRVKSLDYYHPYYCIKSEFYGIFEDNDPKKRLMAVVNNNNDIGEAWEWSDRGLFPIDVSNDAYKLGINYIIYAMSR